MVRMILKWVLLASLGSVLLSCGGKNYFESAADKDSDEALYHDVLKLVDRRDYDAALTKIGQMSSSFQATADVKQTRAGIYAGKCGLDFLVFASSLSGNGVFSLFMSGFTQLTVDIVHCQTAQNIIEDSFGATSVERLANMGSQKGGNVNTFMAVLGMAKIGAQLRVSADADQNGAVDAGYDACNDLTDAEVTQVGTGFGLLLDNFTTIAASLSSTSSTLLNGIATTCANPLFPTNPCTISDPDDPAWSDPVVLTAMRALVKSNGTGIQSCAADDPMNPAPYPFDCCP